MNSLPERLKNFLNDFRSLGSREEQIELLIETAERFCPVPAAIATPPYSSEHRVPGCESEVYIWAVPLPDGTLKFHFAVQNPQGISAKALAAILDTTLSGETLAGISRVTDDIVEEIFGPNLSMGKGQGLKSMVGCVKALAARPPRQVSGGSPPMFTADPNSNR